MSESVRPGHSTLGQSHIMLVSSVTAKVVKITGHLDVALCRRELFALPTDFLSFVFPPSNVSEVCRRCADVHTSLSNCSLLYLRALVDFCCIVLFLVIVSA